MQSSPNSNNIQQHFANDSKNNEDSATNGPDSDTIKMFVGQIPKSWDEEKLTEFFTQYGPVFQLNILRDKESEESKGCCFVTFYHRKDAINAQNELHNIYTMPGLAHPVQMKPADTENRNDRKLFIGMLSKSMEEGDVRELFKEFGQIEDCSILRDQGKSKGCAFLTFVSRSCALQAVRKMNQSQIFEGCTRPVVVKFVNGGKEKNSGTTGWLETNKTHLESNGNIGTVDRLISQQQVISKPLLGIDILSNLASLLQQPGFASLLTSTHSPQFPQKEVKDAIPSIGLDKQGICSQFAMNQKIVSPFQHLQQFSPKLLVHPALLTQNNQTLLGQTYGLQTLGIHYPITPQNFQQTWNLREMQTSPALSQEVNSRGPEGCNLFIYHLPQEFTDSDLFSLFCNYGPILSAKVFIDKQTNLSKCFGFVSFNNANSAQNAITGMNGLQIGNKRLKVQLKRTDVKPYDKLKTESIS